MIEVANIREALEKNTEKKACLFDMDGLIFDTERSFMEQLSVVMDEYGYRLTREIYCEMLGLGGEVLRRKMKGYFGQDYPFSEISREAVRRVNRIAETVGLTVKPEICDVLSVMMERGIPCAVASSSRSERVRRYMEIVGLAEYFQVIIGGERVSHSKPAPDIFLLAARELGVSPEECVVLEDSENGVCAGGKAGCTTICVPDLKMPGREVWQYIDYLIKRA